MMPVLRGNGDRAFRKFQERRRRVVTVLLVLLVERLSMRSSGIRGALHNDGERGEKRVNELLLADRTIFDYSRLNIAQFKGLLELLDGRLKDGRLISRKQKLAIFMHTVACNCHYRQLIEQYHHTMSTISAVIHEVLRAVLAVYPLLVKPATAADCKPIATLKNGRFFPWFEKAVGAIDGTHIKAHVVGEQAPYRNRKGFLSQNVLAAVNWHGQFTYVLAGWEGTAHDGRVLAHAKAKGFKAPPGHYYLADAGYANTVMTMVPYKTVRYHLREIIATEREPTNAAELFNTTHSSLRNIVERVFGIWKKRFRIFSDEPWYPMETQIMLVYACAALHNFISCNGGSCEDHLAPAYDEDHVDDGAAYAESRTRAREGNSMTSKVEEIAEALWKYRSQRRVTSDVEVEV